MRTAARLVGRVLVRDTCCFKGQADKLAAPGNAGPVQQLVRRVGARFLARRHCRCIEARCSGALGVVSGKLEEAVCGVKSSTRLAQHRMADVSASRQ